MLIDNVEVFADTKEFSTKELNYYVEVVKSKFPKETVTKLTVTLDDDGRVKLDYTKHGEKFERIRRITGYLTGDLNSWNDAKRSEEHDRLKHDTEV